MNELDVNQQMRALIDQETADGPYVSALVAKRIVLKLRDTNPELLFNWLDGQAEEMVRTAINKRDASIRAHAKAKAASSAFGEAAKKYAEGDTEALGDWLKAPYVASAEGERKHLGKMNAKELAYAASTYDNRAKHNAMQAAFLTALANSLTGRQTVGSKFDEATLSRMWISIRESGGTVAVVPKLVRKAPPSVVKSATGARLLAKRTRS